MPYNVCFDCSQVSTRGLVAYFDASFADCVDTRRSTVGYVIYLDGCPVSWKSRLHQRVATSSNNSEYSASAEAGKEILYLRKILTALGEETPTTPVFTDSNGCMALASDDCARLPFCSPVFKDLVGPNPVEWYRLVAHSFDLGRRHGWP